MFRRYLRSRRLTLLRSQAAPQKQPRSRTRPVCKSVSYVWMPDGRMFQSAFSDGRSFFPVTLQAALSVKADAAPVPPPASAARRHPPRPGSACLRRSDPQTPVPPLPGSSLSLLRILPKSECPVHTDLSIFSAVPSAVPSFSFPPCFCCPSAFSLQQ